MHVSWQSEGEGSIDFGFIDANKDQYDEYYEKLLLLLRPGGIIVVDNVLWDCRVLEPNPAAQSTKVGFLCCILCPIWQQLLCWAAAVAVPSWEADMPCDALAMEERSGCKWLQIKSLKDSLQAYGNGD